MAHISLALGEMMGFCAHALRENIYHKERLDMAKINSPGLSA